MNWFFFASIFLQIPKLKLFIWLWSYLKEKLDFDQNQAEKWVINLIHQAKMDATIDSDKNQIIMKPQQPSLYQSILSHAKETSNRTNQLTLAISKIAQGPSPREWHTWNSSICLSQAPSAT